MVSCCKLLGIRSFVLEVRSWSGNNIPVNLYQTKVILCQERASGPKAQLASSKVLVLAKRRQISVGSSLRTRSPNPAKLSSLPCTQPTLPSVSSGCPKSKGRPSLTDCDPGRWLCYLVAETGMGERVTAPQGLGQG